MKLYLLIALLAASAHGANITNAAPRVKNIVQLAQSVPDLSTVVTAVTAGKLVDTLSGRGPFTVFAPTNEAFAKLPAATLTHLLDPKNLKELDNLLTYHVLPEAVQSKNLKPDQEVKTIQGSSLRIRVFGGAGGEVFVNTAKVEKADNEASNGVVHIINGVLIPPSGPAPGPAPGPPPGPAPGPNHLWFAGISVEVDRCGDIDAAPRMPESLFYPENAAALKRYEELTIKLYSDSFGHFPSNVGNLTLGRCKNRGYTINAGKAEGVQWANTGLMNPICAKQCDCAYDTLPGPGKLPQCRDQPDNPSAGKWCSLCGPTYNQVIDINLWVR